MFVTNLTRKQLDTLNNTLGTHVTAATTRSLHLISWACPDASHRHKPLFSGMESYSILWVWKSQTETKQKASRSLPGRLLSSSTSLRLSEGSQRCCRRCEFEPWAGKIPWRRKWQPTPVFLPGKSHGQRSLAGYSLWSCKELDKTWRLNNNNNNNNKMGLFSRLSETIWAKESCIH